MQCLRATFLSRGDSEIRSRSYVDGASDNNYECAWLQRHRNKWSDWLVGPLKDSSDLADAMERLIEDEKLRTRMGLKSREYAVKKYSDDAVVDEMLGELYPFFSSPASQFCLIRTSLFLRTHIWEHRMVMLNSTSATTGEVYVLPSSDDKDGLHNFIGMNSKKQVVAIQGLGFVGTVMSLVVANSDNGAYAVVGVDKATEDSYWKIAEINAGICPIISSDPLVSEFFEEAQRRRNFYATHDCMAFSYADVIIVDINLDVSKVKDESGNIESYDVPLLGFEKAIESIGQACKEDVLILVETTVPPGTCRNVVYPIIVNCLKSRGLRTDKFKLGHSYESHARAKLCQLHKKLLRGIFGN